MRNVVDFFTGGNDLETFANGLLPFGEGMKAYADAVSGMDAGAVSASIIATQALAELQQRASAMGANAVVGVDLDYETLGANGSMLMVTASGTAVLVE